MKIENELEPGAITLFPFQNPEQNRAIDAYSHLEDLRFFGGSSTDRAAGSPISHCFPRKIPWICCPKQSHHLPPLEIAALLGRAPGRPHFEANIASLAPKDAH